MTGKRNRDVSCPVRVYSTVDFRYNLITERNAEMRQQRLQIQVQLIIVIVDYNRSRTWRVNIVV